MIRPQIGLSDIYLDLSVETGTSFERSFTIYSKNGQELSGKVLSTNDKIVPVVTELSGTECEIPFYFKGKMAIPGEEHYGEFLLLTNGGEFNIPYCVSVSGKKYRFGNHIISDLADFYEFAKSDWKRAKDVFFTKDFPEIMLADEEEYRTLYHDLLKGFSKDVIMEQFLMETMKKNPVRLYTDREAVAIGETNAACVVLRKEGWGCVDGRISSESGDLYINHERITQDDFEDDRIEIFLSLKEDAKKDVLMIETAFSKITIPVYREIKKSEDGVIVDRNNRQRAQLLRHFIDFRIGKTELEDFIEKSIKLYPLKGLFYELYCFLLFLIRQNGMAEGTEECEEYGKKLAEKEEEYLEKDECAGFYYYLMSLWKKEDAYRKNAVKEVGRLYEKNRSLRDYLILITMDENLAFQYEAQWEVLVRYLEQGENSPFLYLTLLDILNQEPYLLEQLGEHKTALIFWGIRHQYLSQKLIEQFARLSIREKCFKKNQLSILQTVYEKMQDELYLKAICSMLMKGNKRDQEYHCYFEEAVKRHLNLIGLNEFYLRSLDFETYSVLPKLILYYFHYSSSLDKREKAWLYLNILRNKDAYEDIYENYVQRIEDFVKEQLMEGRMNRYLKQIYEIMLPSMLEDTELAKYIPNIIFKKRLLCFNPMIEGVYVCHPETEEEVHVSFVDGLCQIEVYSDAARIYFADRMGNRYHSGIKYSLESYLDELVYRNYCVENAKDDRRVYVKWINGDPNDKKEQLVRLLAENDELKRWKRVKAVERILDYHYKEKTREDLSECLDRINYTIISPSYRRTLMNYYMACNRMEDAYFGAELYGSDLMEPEQLYLLTCAGLCLHKDEKDDLLLTMAHRSFLNQRYNKEMLIYLRDHYEGRVFDLIRLWSVLNQEHMLTADFEKRVLKQIAFVGSGHEGVFPVLLSYLEKEEGNKITEEILNLYSASYLSQILNGKTGRKNMPEGYFDILDRQAAKNSLYQTMDCLAYLYYKSTAGYMEKEKTIIAGMIREFCKKEIVFPFFEKFEEFILVPGLWKESICFWFESKEKEEYILSVSSGFGEECRKARVKMSEIAPGFYYGNLYMPVFESALQVNVKDYDGSIHMKKMSGFVNGSRNHLLGRMKEEKENSGKWMTEYEKIMGEMKEQLKFLSDR